MTDEYDLVVIGAGSGGLAAAQRAAEYGARVVVVESGPLGGTCVNLGCVPKKIMWNAADLGGALHDAEDYGFELEVNGHDWAHLKRARDAYVQRLNHLYGANLAKRGVELVRARARLIEAHRVRAGERSLAAPHVLIATGGRPQLPAIPGTELGISSDGFFALTSRPERVAVVGGSYIALELANILCALGSETTLILRGETVLRSFDAMLGEAALANLRGEGVEVVTGAMPRALRRAADGQLELEAADGRRLGGYDALLWAIGRVPALGELGLEAAGVRLSEQGFIATDKYQETSAKAVYAVGDVTGRAQLTPVAIAAGRRLSDRVFGAQKDRHLDYEMIPTVIFARPPAGTVGLSEREAREQYGNEHVSVFRASFVPLYNALTREKVRTEMKLVTVGAEQRIVGLHVVGQGADEMLQGFAVAMRMGATKKDFDDTVAIHPTSAEEFVTMR
ncbi:MAG TPA: glutathione-disulfide reductase [Steroidobacteraceae bacterium]|nr:glutathione-disulfide reductase [Steroidobacteraceae bacterium]